MHAIVVERATGRAIRDAEVLSGETTLAVTDVEGHAAWALERGGLIHVDAVGFGKVFAIVDSSCTDRANALQIELDRGATLRGHVLRLPNVGPFTARVMLDGNDAADASALQPDLRSVGWTAPSVEMVASSLSTYRRRSCSNCVWSRSTGLLVVSSSNGSSCILARFAKWSGISLLTERSPEASSILEARESPG